MSFIDTLGHVTTTELKNAFEWMNKNRFGGRGASKVDYPYVNYILKQGKECVNDYAIALYIVLLT